MVLIDDPTIGEFTSHSLLAQHKLAPPLLARFQNGLLYKFIRGQACTSSDLTKESVWRGVAKRLGQWHAVLPTVAEDDQEPASGHDTEQTISLSLAGSSPSGKDTVTLQAIRNITPNLPSPNIWMVMQKWILALPVGTDAERERKVILQKELERIVKDLGDTQGLGKNGVSCHLISTSTRY